MNWAGLFTPLLGAIETLMTAPHFCIPEKADAFTMLDKLEKASAQFAVKTFCKQSTKKWGDETALRVIEILIAVHGRQGTCEFC